MNFTVVRGADTPWGNAFARALAADKRHLILLGAREEELQTLLREIIRKHRVLVHYMISDDGDTGSIVSVCEKINDRFEVDLLINYTETGFGQRLDDYDVRSLDRKLKTQHATGILYLHQLLPNLLLHAHAQVIDLWCPSNHASGWEQTLIAFNTRFADYLNAEMRESGLRIDTIDLSSTAESTDRVVTILESILPGFREYRVAAG